WLNGTGSEQLIFIFIDSFSRTDRGGDFALDAAVLPASAELPGDVCEDAVPLPLGGRLTGETTTGYHNDYSTSASALSPCQMSNAGADRAYGASVPPGQRLTVTVTPSGTFLPSLF